MVLLAEIPDVPETRDNHAIVTNCVGMFLCVLCVLVSMDATALVRIGRRDCVVVERYAQKQIAVGVCCC